MKIRNIVQGGIFLAGLATYGAGVPAASASTLQSPDSDALTAAYQVVQFDLQECQALRSRPGVATNASGPLSPDVLKVAARVCNDAKGFKPTLEELAKAHNFVLPADLPYEMSARYAELVRSLDTKFAIQYLRDQISSHEDALAIFQEVAATGTDPQIKEALSRAIPTMQADLTLLRETLAKH